uniref:Uncharacterized protein n=1 Tax=Strigamia maritima TaxID=126957 RepID=T1JKK6_STRMM
MEAGLSKLEFIKSLTLWKPHDNELEFYDDEMEDSHWILRKLKLTEVRQKLGRNVTLQIAATFVYSQLVTRQIYLSHSDTDSFVGFVTSTLWILERIGQSFGFALYYLWLLKQEEDDIDW